MDAVVQFIRNGLCCIQDLDLFRSSFLHDPEVTALYYKFPEPLDKMSPLNFFISVTQFYVVVTATKAGLSLITTSIGKLRRITRLLSQREKDTTPEGKIVSASLLKEGKYALRSIIIGCCLVPIGISFTWLSAHNWQLTPTNWLGGLPALIHALEVMELCMLPLLYYMLVDGSEQLEKSKRLQQVAEKLQSGKVSADLFTLETFEAMTEWCPFWDKGTEMFDRHHDSEIKLFEKEVIEVRATLSKYLGNEKKDGEKEDKIRAQTLRQAGDSMEVDALRVRAEGYREYLYFVLNMVAFYGYFLCILCYYYDNDEDQPPLARNLKFGYPSKTADWHGNFFGDLMWTIEPVVILASPFWIARTYPKKEPSKVKAD